jgi:hypothetical protein
MRRSISRRRPFVLGTMLTVLFLGTACDDETPVEPEPMVATMRLTVGSQTVDVASNGAVTGGPIVISANTAISAQWLLANGMPEPLVTAAEFQLNATPADMGVVTFTRTSAFAGTLNKVTTGSTTIAFALYHIEEMHEDFGPHNVSITVN